MWHLHRFQPCQRWHQQGSRHQRIHSQLWHPGRQAWYDRGTSSCGDQSSVPGRYQGQPRARRFAEADRLHAAEQKHRRSRSLRRALRVLPGPEDQLRLRQDIFNDGKVRAVWRDDTTSTYAYEKTIGDMGAKYAGAMAIKDYFDILVDGRRTSDGSKAENSFELYKAPTPTMLRRISG
jgi:hypothetical protein